MVSSTLNVCLNQRQKRKALDGTLDDMGEKKFETNYPLPVSLVDGAWPTEGDGSLDRLVIRALERSHGWAQLSATLGKYPRLRNKLGSMLVMVCSCRIA